MKHARYVENVIDWNAIRRRRVDNSVDITMFAHF